MDGRTRLAKAFGDWIEFNGWTQTEVVAMGGPSTTIQTKVTKTDEPISRQTLKQIDLVMNVAQTLDMFNISSYCYT